MSRWWRAYDEALNDPKLQKLSGDLFKSWFNLLCLASKNEGQLPPMDDVAFALRTTPVKAAGIVTELVVRKLFDRDGNRFIPHNWESRQFKSDVSNDRVQRFRERQRNAQCTVTETANETPPEQSQTQKVGGGEDAGARGSLISAEANRVADEVAEICGIVDPLAWPPGWCGSAGMVQKWLNEGCRPEIIVPACREAMMKKSGGAPDTIKYFEKAVARAQAEFKTPMPTVIPGKPEQISGERAGNRNRNGSDRKDAFAAALDDLERAAEAGGLSSAGEPVDALLPNRGRA